MQTLTAARTALATALGALDHVPETIDPPCVVVEPGDPYITYDGVENYAHDTLLACCSVYVLVPANDNNVMAQQLDTDLIAALNAIEDDTDEWSIERVGRPGTFTTTDWQAYGVQLTCTARVAR